MNPNNNRMLRYKSKKMWLNALESALVEPHHGNIVVGYEAQVSYYAEVRLLDGEYKHIYAPTHSEAQQFCLDNADFAQEFRVKRIEIPTWTIEFNAD